MSEKYILFASSDYDGFCGGALDCLGVFDSRKDAQDANPHSFTDEDLDSGNPILCRAHVAVIAKDKMKIVSEWPVYGGEFGVIDAWGVFI